MRRPALCEVFRKTTLGGSYIIADDLSGQAHPNKAKVKSKKVEVNRDFFTFYFCLFTWSVGSCFVENSCKLSWSATEV